MINNERSKIVNETQLIIVGLIAIIVILGLIKIYQDAKEDHKDN